MRKPLLRVITVPLVFLLVACGSGSSNIEHPTGHSDVVVRLDETAGTGTQQSTFATIPRVVLTGDGTGYVAMQETTMTGVVSPVVRLSVTDSDLASILARANDDHLLAGPLDYASSDQVSDGETTSVRLTTGDGSWTHEAYALGEGATQESGDRARLEDFVAYLTAWSDHQHADEAVEDWAPALRVMAGPLPFDAQPDGTVGRWPDDAGVRLADVGSCRVVRDPVAVHALTTGADHFYRDHGDLFVVAAAVLLPGDSCEP